MIDPRVWSTEQVGKIHIPKPSRDNNLAGVELVNQLDTLPWLERPEGGNKVKFKLTRTKSKYL